MAFNDNLNQTKVVHKHQLAVSLTKGIYSRNNGRYGQGKDCLHTFGAPLYHGTLRICFLF